MPRTTSVDPLRNPSAFSTPPEALPALSTIAIDAASVLKIASACACPKETRKVLRGVFLSLDHDRPGTVLVESTNGRVAFSGFQLPFPMGDPGLQVPESERVREAVLDTESVKTLANLPGKAPRGRADIGWGVVVLTHDGTVPGRLKATHPPTGRTATVDTTPGRFPDISAAHTPAAYTTGRVVILGADVIKRLAALAALAETREQSVAVYLHEGSEAGLPSTRPVEVRADFGPLWAHGSGAQVVIMPVKPARAEDWAAKSEESAV